MTDNKSAFEESKDGRFEFPQEMNDLIAEVVRQQQAQFRTCKRSVSPYPSQAGRP